MHQLGEKIRLLRRTKGWTQEQLVQGIAKKSTISQIESGKASPSLDLLLQIAERLDVSMGELLQDVTWERKTPDLLKLANILFDKREYAYALQYFKLYQSEANDQEENLEFLWKMAICLAESGETERALAVLEHVRMLAVSRNDCYWRFQTLVQIGQFYYKQSNNKVALHYWLKAKDRIPFTKDLDFEQKWNLHNRIGVIYFYLGDHEKAVQFYLEGLEWVTEPEFYTQRSITLMNLAISLKHLGDYERAEEMYQKLEQVQGELEPLIHAYIHFHYAIFLSVVGKYKEALHLFASVRKRFTELREEEQLVVIDSEIADVYRRQRNYVKAMEVCTSLLESIPQDHPEYGYIQRTMGLIHMNQEKYDDAVGFLTTALHLFEQQGRVGYVKATHEYLADCLRRKKELQ